MSSDVLLFSCTKKSASNIGPNNINNCASKSTVFCTKDFNNFPCGEDSVKNGPAATINFKLPAQNWQRSISIKSFGSKNFSIRIGTGCSTSLKSIFNKPCKESRNNSFFINRKLPEILSHNSCFVKHNFSTQTDGSFLLIFSRPKLHVTSPVVENSFSLNYNNRNINISTFYIHRSILTIFVY
ncbi:hypothetical protein AGLY_014519 [Aphis glycines]|uniref:Uncharacterized protein n=1 Tax=Aphis glycines TaxID=307491 RepID=A0A6G0T439_APHGL|nr:hypothetical protein AGLY_014519 [Aphis glycines]